MDESLYKEIILDLYRNPLNKTQLDDFDIEETGHNPSCGDRVVVRIKLDEDVVSEIGWQGDGCAISTAAVSLITDEIKSKNKNEIQEITKDAMLKMLGIPISHTRLKCALLGWETIQRAMNK